MEAFLLEFLGECGERHRRCDSQVIVWKIMEFKHSGDNYHHFCDMLNVMERHLNQIQSSSSQRHAEFSPAVEICIKRLISIVRNAKRQDLMNKIALIQPPVPLMQPEPQTGLVGDVIKDREEELLKLLHRDNRARIIVVYGMGGVGKTTLLQKVYNSVIKENSVFKISDKNRLTISQEYEVAKL